MPSHLYSAATPFVSLVSLMGIAVAIELPSLPDAVILLDKLPALLLVEQDGKSIVSDIKMANRFLTGKWVYITKYMNIAG